MGPDRLDWFALLLAVVPLAFSFAVFRVFRIGLAKELAVSVIRMSVQLFLVGLYLTFLFRWDNPLISVGYILFMVAAANCSVLKNTGLSGKMYGATYPPLAFSILVVLGWYTVLVFTPTPIYSAKYLIPVAGMLLGNSMRRTIITLERFYSSIRDDEEGFASLILYGATVREAAYPYFRQAYRVGVAPALAGMATIGLVSLPGMMTGQILGGADPIVAVQYQAVIMLAIFVTTELATLLSVQMSYRRGFGPTGFFRREIMKAR